MVSDHHQKQEYCEEPSEETEKLEYFTTPPPCSRGNLGLIDVRDHDGGAELDVHLGIGHGRSSCSFGCTTAQYGDIRLPLVRSWASIRLFYDVCRTPGRVQETTSTHFLLHGTTGSIAPQTT